MARRGEEQKTDEKVIINKITLDGKARTTAMFLEELNNSHMAHLPGLFAASIIKQYYELRELLDQHGIVWVGHGEGTTALAGNGEAASKSQSNGQRRKIEQKQEDEQEPESNGQGDELVDMWKM